MKKRIILVLSTVLLLAVTVGATVAFLVDQTPSLPNTFQPVSVACRVQEVFDANANTKRDVSVLNTGDISAYIRVALVVTWVSNTSGTTYGGAPVAGVDYQMTLNPSGWKQGTDGFYYCTTAVEAGDATPILVTSVTPVAGQAPEGYRLSVQILASAIQAEPAEAVQAAWSGMTVHTNGTITPD